MDNLQRRNGIPQSKLSTKGELDTIRSEIAREVLKEMCEELLGQVINSGSPVGEILRVLADKLDQDGHR